MLAPEAPVILLTPAIYSVSCRSWNVGSGGSQALSGSRRAVLKARDANTEGKGRYLWTDASAVVNVTSLGKATEANIYLEQVRSIFRVSLFWASGI